MPSLRLAAVKSILQRNYGNPAADYIGDAYRPEHLRRAPEAEHLAPSSPVRHTSGQRRKYPRQLVRNARASVRADLHLSLPLGRAPTHAALQLQRSQAELYMAVSSVHPVSMSQPSLSTLARCMARDRRTFFAISSDPVKTIHLAGRIRKDFVIRRRTAADMPHWAVLNRKNCREPCGCVAATVYSSRRHVADHFSH